MVHSMITSYGLLNKMKLIKAEKATESQLLSFHSQGYIDYIKAIDNKSSQSTKCITADQPDEDLNISVAENDFGIGYDCSPVDNMLNLVQVVGGGSIAAARALIAGSVDIAVNWCGGWHHAHKDEASGYCYVNDINLAILEFLSSGLRKVLYVDFDLHHGDAVEHAFSHTEKVMTVSFHKYECGFFPGTGNVTEIGSQKGKYYAVNVPLNDAIRDDNYTRITRTIVAKAVDQFKPQVIIGQFGCDSLAGDPMLGFNLTERSLVACLEQLITFNKPLLVLGGGGYLPQNAAKAWTRLTATVLGEHLSNDIPDHDQYFLSYAPAFDLTIDECHRKDQNSAEYIEELITKVCQLLDYVN